MPATTKAARGTQTSRALPPQPHACSLGLSLPRDLTPSEVRVEKKGKAGAPARRALPAWSQNTNPQPPNRQPKIYDRNVTILDGPRHSRRPSSVARKKGKRNITDVEWADTYDEPEDCWSDDDLLPAETTKDDCGWVAGPICRELPPFRGPPPGPTDALPDEKSTRLTLPYFIESSSFVLGVGGGGGESHMY